MARAFLGLLALLVVTGCSQNNLSFLDPHGPVAAAQRTHFWIVVALTLVVVLPVIVLTPVLVWKYRYGGESTYRPRWSFSKRLEYLIWGVPFLIVAILGYFLWQQTYSLDPYKPLPSDQKPLHVQVVGYDWKWLFIYPEQNIATVNELVFPAERPLELELTSDTVMQSFFVPALGSQIYAMHGMVTRLHLLADHPGTYRGENTQYNGERFHEQHFTAKAVTEAAFDDFIAGARRHGHALDRPTYQVLDGRNTVRELARALGEDGQTEALRFSATPDDLFSAIVAGTPGEALAPGPVSIAAQQTPLAFQRVTTGVDGPVAAAAALTPLHAADDAMVSLPPAGSPRHHQQGETP
ncbi:cytochrome ubiquinol oxidase subunit II [Modicisalibacter coralii]|uniref:cytochrome ubiquinol oxidase subunit II n=1 Tax=Modicisalibacter coralii TaxID=2304602 RepID=UPI00193A2EA4|nr:cytochrome ubiquinol oxidase subunit II [Halomonas coralii]